MSRSSSPLKDRLVFVVGARRSGTNWLQRILGAHPAVVCVPSETYLFSLGLTPLVERFHHGVIGSPETGHMYMDRQRLLDALRDFCDEVFEGLSQALNPSAERIVERTPDHVRNLELMGEVYPDARFLHIVRDGRDVARSLRSQPWGPSSIAEAAEEWRSAIEAARIGASRIEHFLDVRYEELLADPRKGIEEIFRWLGVDSRAPVVETALIEAGVQFNVDPMARTIGEGKWRKEFTAADVADFDRIAGPTLTSLGYAPSEPSISSPPTPAPTDVPDYADTSVVRLLRRVRSRLRALRRTGDGRLDRALQVRQRRCHLVVDRFLNATGQRRWDEASSLVAPSVFVRIVEADGVWEGRGPEARTHFLSFLSSDPALSGSQIRGDIHPSLPTLTVVAAYQTDAGALLNRVWTMTVVNELIQRITYYTAALAHPADAGGSLPGTARTDSDA